MRHFTPDQSLNNSEAGWTESSRTQDRKLRLSPKPESVDNIIAFSKALEIKAVRGQHDVEFVLN